MGAEGNRGEFNHKGHIDRIGRRERGIKAGDGDRNFDRFYRMNSNRMDRMGVFAHGHCGASPEMLRRCGSGLFGLGLCFGSVTGRCGHAPSPKLRPKTKNPRSSSPHPFCQRSLGTGGVSKARGHCHRQGPCGTVSGIVPNCPRMSRIVRGCFYFIFLQGVPPWECRCPATIWAGEWRQHAITRNHPQSPGVILFFCVCTRPLWEGNEDEDMDSYRLSEGVGTPGARRRSEAMAWRFADGKEYQQSGGCVARLALGLSCTSGEVLAHGHHGLLRPRRAPSAAKVLAHGKGRI
ncbi:MAG: hypothetical protein JWR26_4687 [Pedosphaera sp.]|nr:hypothetical protein [Pedosphaera sp.]